MYLHKSIKIYWSTKFQLSNNFDILFIYFFLRGDVSYKLYLYDNIYIYNEHIHINVSPISIQIYSDIRLLLMII